MSDLMKRMRNNRLAQEALKSTPAVTNTLPTTAKSVATPTPTPTPKLGIGKLGTPKEAPAVEEKKPSIFAKKSATLSGLNELNTTITSAVSASDRKVMEQREAGVYDLPERATEILGAEADLLITTMQELDAAIIDRTPEIRTLSRKIRTNLEQYPELVHILKDEQLHIMVQGYLTIANVKTAPKTKAAVNAGIQKKADSVLKLSANKSVDDLF